jgi:hypothetical protein
MRGGERRRRDKLMLCSKEVAMVRGFCAFPMMEAFHFLLIFCIALLPASVLLLIHTEAALSLFFRM